MPQQFQALFSEGLKPVAVIVLRVILIVSGAWITNTLLRRGFNRTWLYFVQSMQRGRRSDPEFEKQAATIAGVMERTTSVAIYMLAVVMALRELGFDVAPLLAGAGVASIAIGFGAQNLVRDVIAGIFLLWENQIRVNDVAVINDTGGLVEQINLRTTVLRDAEGTVHVFPNGAITKLANRTQGFSCYVFNLNLSYQDDTDKAIALLREAADELTQEDPFKSLMLAPIEIWGVDQLGETHVVVKGRIKTLPGKQWEVGREINRRVKMKLTAAGFDVPARGLRRVEVGLPPGMAVDQDALRAVVREILEEMKALDDDLGDQRPA